VAPLDSFTSSLATARNPSFLAPLAHQVDPAGPSGQVDGLASAVVPQTMSGGPELAVATRPAPTRRSQVAAVVQRALAPRVRFSEPDAASTAGPAAVIPTAAPAPDEPLLASRHLEPVEVPAPRSLTAAPDPGELSTLPVVSSPSAPAVSSSTVPAIPTVSRLESSAACSVHAHPDHHHAPDDAGGQGTEESHAAVQRSALDGPLLSVPLSSAVRPSTRPQRHRSRLRRRRSRARWSRRCSVTPCRTRRWRPPGPRNLPRAATFRHPRTRWTTSGSHCR